MADDKKPLKFATCSQPGVIHPISLSKILQRWKLNLLCIGKHDCDPYK